MAGLNGLNTKAYKYKFYTLTIFPEAIRREGVGYSDMFIHHRLGPLFFFKIFNFNTLRGFQKKKKIMGI